MRSSVFSMCAVAFALALPQSASAASYDGRWLVSVVTRSGSCDSYRWDIGVRNGSVTDVEGRTGSTSGGIMANGKVDIKLMRGADTLQAIGSASGASASGTWSSPTRQCSGTWDGTRS